MVASLIAQFGLDPESVWNPRANRLSAMAEKRYGVFHVEHALGSGSVPAQALSTFQASGITLVAEHHDVFLPPISNQRPLGMLGDL